MRAGRARSAWSVLTAHPWALGMMESRPNPGPALLQHHDRLLGVLMTEGFSVALATHAFGGRRLRVRVRADRDEPAVRTARRHSPSRSASAELYPHIAHSRAELSAAPLTVSSTCGWRIAARFATGPPFSAWRSMRCPVGCASAHQPYAGRKQPHEPGGSHAPPAQRR
ncbi:TetR/AcrR family transcriptional regulator C-terminal domain-containing protein [Lysobacter korlensis]|uniref:TetR/AcrR family transcriptional regulator C-terminal domain-containing protein n=1 Tax=Lysobacter korlensis TaxID=553636 RepID=A0ABV6RXH3_9GAMM